MNISDEDVKKFMEERYPQYKDNITLGRLLYARHLGLVVSGADGLETKDVKIKDVGEKFEGKRVRLRGLVGSLERYEYQSCSKCMRKNCSCDAEKVPRTRLTILFGDETGCIKCVQFVNGVSNDVEVGGEYYVEGLVKKTLDGDGNPVYLQGRPVYEIVVNKFEKHLDDASSEDEEKVYEFVRKAKRVKVDVVKNLCKELGVDYGKLKLKEVDGYVTSA